MCFMRIILPFCIGHSPCYSKHNFHNTLSSPSFTWNLKSHLLLSSSFFNRSQKKKKRHSTLDTLTPSIMIKTKQKSHTRPTPKKKKINSHISTSAHLRNRILITVPRDIYIYIYRNTQYNYCLYVAMSISQTDSILKRKKRIKVRIP